jgi:hypothetical protein
MVAVGAAEHEPGLRTYFQRDFMGSITSASYRFGAVPEVDQDDAAVDTVAA